MVFFHQCCTAAVEIFNREKNKFDFCFAYFTEIIKICISLKNSRLLHNVANNFKILISCGKKSSPLENAFNLIKI
jgi:hypothetical protein